MIVNSGMKLIATSLIPDASAAFAEFTEAV